MKNRIAIALAALALTACAVGNRSTVETAAYDLGPAASSGSPSFSNPGVALDVRLPAWLDGLTMSYRLAYADPQRVYGYTQARWAGAPARMAQQRLWQLLGTASGSVPCTLHIELGEFVQVFDAPDRSRAVVSGDATLQGRGRMIIAHLPFRAEVAAGTDARSGAAALAAATAAVAATLGPWLEGRRTACPPPV